MKRRAIGVLLVLGIVLAGCAGREATVPPGDAAAQVTALADEFLDAYLDRYFLTYPTRATAAGRHDLMIG